MNEDHPADEATTGRDVLRSIEGALRNADAAARMSVVSIGRDGRGSGFVIGQDRVLTSAHNLRDATTSVTFADARTEQGAVHGSDRDGDLVVISVATGESPALEFAATIPAIGDAVAAASRGGHRNRVTLGFVSDVDRAFSGPGGQMVPGGFEHTAPLVRGSSGGPVLDLDGKVVGIDTHRSGEGFYLARTADPALRDRIAELGEGRTVRRRRLGVALAPNEVATRLRAAVGLPERAGLLVHEVVADGPAGRAGVAAGDLLVRAGSVDLVDVDALQRVLADQTPATLDLTVVRGTEERTVTVTFEDEPAQDSPSQHEPAQD